MTPERWQQIKVLFELALNQEAANRDSFLDQECKDDHQLRQEVESLLKSHEHADSFVDDLAIDISRELFSDADEDRNIGRRLGPYEIIQLIGGGGMGQVFLGIRADDQYQKRVAIKLIRSGMNSEFLIRRFRTERQILANLDHPNIARLLDGGTTESGMPYLVMEFIEGSPIDEYCNTNRLGTVDRLMMFRQVCSAVQYAHQNLIIHRDIKPSNILVTADSTPKLLDFGIAKLLDPAQEEDETGTAMGLMTPEYASPEQVRGEPITTASDVYSLGVVLYRLLSGHHPYRIKSRVPEEILRVVCEEDPPKPSAAVTRVLDETTVAGSSQTRPMDGDVQTLPEDPERLRRRLSGDLDMIVMMALRKEPERRYSSVEQFSEDIRRHTEGLPVLAAKNTFSYQARKFITRHKVGVAAALVILLALLVGLWQSFNAHLEKQRAERVSSDLSTVVESFMFQVDDSIQSLEGSTPARELIVTRALGYLDKLAREAGDDLEANRKLASAYSRVGDIQGRPGFPNIGDTPGAIGSYEKALEIRKKLAARQPSDLALKGELATSFERMGDTLRMVGKSDSALDDYRQALTIRESLLEKNPTDTTLGQDMAGNYQRLGELMAQHGDPSGALQVERKGLTILEQVVQSTPGNPSIQRTLGISYIKVGDALNSTGDHMGALDNYRKSTPIYEALAKGSPDNSRYRRELAISYDKVGNGLSATHDPASALDFYKKSLDIRQALASGDPRNMEARRDLSISYDKLGTTMMALNQQSEALAYYQKALDNDQRLTDEDPKNSQALDGLTDSLVKVADVQLQMGNASSALGNYKKATGIREQLLQDDPNDIDLKGDLAEAYQKTADTYWKLGTDTGLSTTERLTDRKAARELYQKGANVLTALRDAHQLSDDNAKMLADIQSGLAKCDQEGVRE
jgi:eukaryotic-like serine/threonine-protein kinase